MTRHDTDHTAPARPPGSRRETLPLLLLAAATAIIDELIDRLAEAGYTDLRPSYSRVFEHIDPDGTRLTELARRARMTHPSMIELVARIEALGYVERLPDPTDRRARIVRLTPSGRALQRRALTELAGIEAAWLERLGQDIRDRLDAAVRHIER